MAKTNKYKIPYPDSIDNVDIPKDMEELANKVEEVLENKAEKSLDELKELSNSDIFKIINMLEKE